MTTPAATAELVDRLLAPLERVEFKEQLCELYIASVKLGILVRAGFLVRLDAVAALIEKASDVGCWGRGAQVCIWRGVPRRLSALRM